MNGWQDTSATHYTNGSFNPQTHAAYNNAFNPSTAAIFNPASFEASPFQATQFAPRMQDGGAHAQSLHNSPYQVNPVIPSKRPRPSEDGIGASPRPGPMNYPGQALHASAQYQHLRQSGSATATPSPVLQDGQFRAPSIPQRYQTHSPNPYPQTANNLVTHGSPQPDQVNRVITPQASGNTSYGQGMQVGQGPQYRQAFGQPFAPMSGMQSSATLQTGLPAQGVQLSQNLQQRQMDKQREYLIRQQQYQHQLQASNLAARHQTAGLPGMGNNPMHGQQTQYGTGITNQGAQMTGFGAPNAQAHQFLKTIGTFMQSNGREFNPTPLVCGRPINLAQLFSVVLKVGGSASITAARKWVPLGANLGFHPQQFPTAAEELKQAFEQNLAPYEMAWIMRKQQQRPSGMHQSQMPAVAGLQPQISAAQSQEPTLDQHTHRTGQAPQNFSAQQPPATVQSTPRLHNHNVSTQNGYLTPQQSQSQLPEPSPPGRHRSSLSRDLTTTTSQNQDAPTSTPAKEVDQRSSSQPAPILVGTSVVDGGTSITKPDELESPYRPSKRVLIDQNDTHGGLKVDVFCREGESLARARPNVPGIQEMGLIDIEALTLSLQSGVHAEVRLALDHLIKISILDAETFLLDLQHCDDLLDSLVDCAEDQLEFLTGHTAEDSDAFGVASYQETLRASLADVKAIQDVPEFGTLEYELHRAVDRLIAVTSILRNLSIGGESSHRLLTVTHNNQMLLAGERTIRYISNTIRHLGTRILFLRTQANTQDFLKDALIFISNIADKVELPSREEALSLLHLLLSFAPDPPPETSESGVVRFSSYRSRDHIYLPPAIDTLAKLLARDDPNRSFYRAIFQADAASSPPHSLLTRAFALAVSTVPERTEPPEKQIQLANVRLATLAHSMVAADILASLAPAAPHPLARTWLDADDGFAPALFYLLCRFMRPEQRMHAAGPTGRPDPERAECSAIVVHRGLSMLKRLIDRCDGVDAFRFPMEVLPRKETLVAYSLRPPHEVDPVALRLLCRLTSFGR